MYIFLLLKQIAHADDYLEYAGLINNVYRKKSSGLSTGGIIVIIIRCVLVLLAVGAIASLWVEKPQDLQPKILQMLLKLIILLILSIKILYFILYNYDLINLF